MSVRGMRELIARLRKVEDGLRQLKDTNRSAAQVVLTAAVGTAPLETGRLAFTGRSGATQRAGIVRFGYTATVPYACPIHWGWAQRPYKPKGIRGGPIPANPWASRAAVDTQPLWYETYVKEVERLWDL